VLDPLDDVLAVVQLPFLQPPRQAREPLLVPVRVVEDEEALDGRAEDDQETQVAGRAGRRGVVVVRDLTAHRDARVLREPRVHCG